MIFFHVFNHNDYLEIALQLGFHLAGCWSILWASDLCRSFFDSLDNWSACWNILFPNCKENAGYSVYAQILQTFLEKHTSVFGGQGPFLLACFSNPSQKPAFNWNMIISSSFIYKLSLKAAQQLLYYSLKKWHLIKQQIENSHQKLYRVCSFNQKSKKIQMLAGNVVSPEPQVVAQATSASSSLVSSPYFCRIASVLILLSALLSAFRRWASSRLLCIFLSSLS